MSVCQIAHQTMLIRLGYEVSAVSARSLTLAWSMMLIKKIVCLLLNIYPAKFGPDV